MNSICNIAFTVIIPARFASTRLPGKPLLPIGHKSMIERVYQQALKSHAERVIVATDDQRIAETVQRFGGNVCITSPDHTSGTTRLQEVAQHYHLDDEQIVVNVQGDEPGIPPAVINQVATNLYQASHASVATLSEPVTTVADFSSPDIVKVVADHQQMALYFSRAAIPFPRDDTPASLLTHPQLCPQRHIGIYAYRVSLLHRFSQWAPTAIEKLENLEQLRILYYGEKIHIEPACQVVPGGVDTLEDLERIRRIIN